MKKILFICIAALSLCATEINWLHSYKEAMKVAQDEDKPVLVYINKVGCGSCAVMNELVLEGDKEVIEYISANFVALSVDVVKNDLPNDLKSTVTPVFHYLDAEGAKIKESLIGGKTGKHFLNPLIEVKELYSEH